MRSERACNAACYRHVQYIGEMNQVADIHGDDKLPKSPDFFEDLGYKPPSPSSPPMESVESAATGNLLVHRTELLILHSCILYTSHVFY